MTQPAGNPTDFESFLTWEALTGMLSYDPAKGEFRWVKSDRPGWVGRVAGHVNRRDGYRAIVLGRRTYRVSRLAWLHETKRWPVGVIDHINGNRSDDRWENLRDVSPAENALNKSLNRNNATGVSGVRWDAERERYVGRLAIDGERKYLGSFETIEEAEAARQAAEVEHYGEFRREYSVPAAEVSIPRIRLAPRVSRKGVPADVSSGLNHAMLIRILSYDPATGEFRWLEANHGEVKIGLLAGKTNKKGYRVIGIGGCAFYGHRLAWLYVTGKWPAALIDHKDGDPSNNAWSNLRAATSAQNNANRVATPGKSGITGVVWHRALGKWMARASLDNKTVYLGVFDTIELAAAARAAFDQKERGEFRARKQPTGAAEVGGGNDAQVFDAVEYFGNRR